MKRQTKIKRLYLRYLQSKDTFTRIKTEAQIIK